MQIEFDAQEIQAALPDYRYVSKLGSGAFASVHLVADRVTNQQKAVKKISCFGMGDYEKNGAANEARILGSLDHRNIIKVFSCLFDNNQQIMYMFMEYACDGDLTVLIDQAKQKKKRIPEATVWKAIWDISSGLQYLHQNRIIHRDIKPANIFRSNKCFKIGDMNVSKVIKCGSLASTKTGSPLYTAPEVWVNEYYDEKCDIWSLGTLVYELCSLKVAFEAFSIEQLKSKIKLTAKSKTLPSLYSSELQNLFKKMIQIDPKKRISAEEVALIAKQRLRMETENEAPVQNLLETIIFPETHQRWVNLIPLPPKTCKKQNNGSMIRKDSSVEKHHRVLSKKKSEDSTLQNNSNIFMSERPSIPRSKSRSKNLFPGDNNNNPPPTNRVPRVKLPSIHKRNSTIDRNQSPARKKSRSISRQKSKDPNERTRDSSNSSKINKKMVERYITSAKRLINDGEY